MIAQADRLIQMMRPTARRNFRLLLVLLAALFLAVGIGRTTSSAASAQNYDAPAFSRVDAQAVHPAEASPAWPSNMGSNRFVVCARSGCAYDLSSPVSCRVRVLPQTRQAPRKSLSP